VLVFALRIFGHTDISGPRTRCPTTTAPRAALYWHLLCGYLAILIFLNHWPNFRHSLDHRQPHTDICYANILPYGYSSTSGQVSDTHWTIGSAIRVFSMRIVLRYRPGFRHSLDHRQRLADICSANIWPYKYFTATGQLSHTHWTIGSGILTFAVRIRGHTDISPLRAGCPTLTGP